MREQIYTAVDSHATLFAHNNSARRFDIPHADKSIQRQLFWKLMMQQLHVQDLACQRLYFLNI